MFGFGIYLMRLADYLEGRKRQKEKKCDVCGQKFGSLEEMENHRRGTHPEVSPDEKNQS